jgi:enterochelin esterase family protein
MNARLDYKFIIPTSEYILDPLNSHYCTGGYGPNSELAMPSYIQPWEIIARNVKHGSLQTKTIASTYLAANYAIYIYLPPGYSATDTKHYPSVYFHDGQDYLNLASAQNVIENILDSGKIAPFIGVFIRPNNRDDEMMGTKRDAYRLFVVKELVPYIDANYKTITAPQSRVVIGTSLGGNISGLIVYYHPDVFAKCGLHSAAFWVNNFEASNLILAAPPKGIDYFAAWGTYEDTYQWMRPFKDSLQKHGFRFGWSERPEGHSWGLWRATLDSMLSFLVPATTASIHDVSVKATTGFTLSQCYPNPFNGTVSVQYNLSKAGMVDVAIYDINGKQIQSVLHEYQIPGSRTLRVPMLSVASGAYFLRLTCGGNSQTRPLLLLK